MAQTVDYAAVLEDLRRKKLELEKEFHEKGVSIDAAIVSIQQIVTPTGTTQQRFPVTPAPEHAAAHLPYRGIGRVCE